MRLSLILALCLSFATAFAENLIIYPLESQDALLGYALADQLTEAFDGSLEVYGPAVAPNLEAPIIVEGGFLSLRRLNVVTASPEGSSLVRSIIGADKVLTGEIDFVDGQLEARFFLATPERVERFLVTAPEAEPSLLLSRSISRLAMRLDLGRPDYQGEIDLSSSYADYVRALALLSFGELGEASNALESVLAEGDDERAAQLLDDVNAVQVGGEGSNAALMATMSLSNTPVDEALSVRYFKEFAGQTDLPVAQTWVATLLASQESEEAAAAFEAIQGLYPFGQAASSAYMAQQGGEPDYNALLTSDDFAVLLTAAFVAQGQENTSVEKEFLTKLTNLQPTYVYPFERLSFIAFDEDDPLAAGKALAVATRLAPDSDLYWTNLGWSYYLLGVLDKSESASVRATVLNPAQNIAFFNLGLVRVVTGRLDEAMDAYAEAIALDPEVDDEALNDLVNALELYPNQAGVHYALASLYEQEGQREKAAEQFELYLAAGGEAPFDRFAQQRIDILRAPPAPIEISDGARFGLGKELLQSETYQAGDRLYTSFELFTPGAELPGNVTARLSLQDADTNTLVSREQSIEIPRNAIGYVVDTLNLDLPSDLAPGSYTLNFEISASEDRQVDQSYELEVSGEASFLRQLISRNIVMTDLENGSAFYTDSDLNQSDSYLTDKLLAELVATAEAADEALPVTESGRFAGLSGGEIFNQSTPEDIQDFLADLLSGETGDASFSFVDAYAQWAIEGAGGSQ